MSAVYRLSNLPRVGTQKLIAVGTGEVNRHGRASAIEEQLCRFYRLESEEWRELRATCTFYLTPDARSLHNRQVRMTPGCSTAMYQHSNPIFQNIAAGRICWTRLAVIVLALLPASAHAQARLSRLTLKNGLSFDGKFDSIDEIAKNLAVLNVTAGGVAVKNIVIVDDELRRTFFAKRNLVSVDDAEQETVVKLRSRPSKINRRVGNLGAVLNAQPFDEQGRRTITVMTQDGRKDLVQEIVEISPVYTRLQLAQGFYWDMRIATSTIPSSELRTIFMNRGKDENEKIDARLNLVRILFLSERYQDAARELDLIIQAYPTLDQEQLKRQHEALVQQGAQLILREIELRRKAGQHHYASFMLRGFANSGVAATEDLIQARDILTEYDTATQQAEQVLQLLEPLASRDLDQGPRQKMIHALHKEIQSDLNIYNLPRMADFLRLAVGGDLTDDEKLAIAISGWLLGQGDVIQNLDVASSLLDVRNLTRDYLRAMGADKKELRQELLGKIGDREGGTPKYVSKLLLNMKPPLDMPDSTDVTGMFHVDVPDMPEGFPVKYTVQLPPEYDPYRRYPTIVSLHAAGAAPEAQINWWAGDFDQQKKQRIGQASRHGYIVLAPAWSKPRQTKYEYSPREHRAVLTALRDATRRFSIDADRVFLSGHALGGDAAWDIAVAHPDLWAGLVTIGAKSGYGKQAPQYITFYDDNARHFPMYFVFGELDSGKMADNALPLNNYMRAGFDAIVVQYQGRGNEHFFEEIHRIYDWMSLQKRTLPTNRDGEYEFTAKSMRQLDRFFWFAEFEGFPERTMTSPYRWPVKKPRTTEINAKVNLQTNRIYVRSGADHTTVWLSPEFMSFDEQLRLSVDGKSIKEDFQPELAVMLEDARTRADRQHVFWSKIEIPPRAKVNR